MAARPPARTEPPERMGALGDRLAPTPPRAATSCSREPPTVPAPTQPPTVPDLGRDPREQADLARGRSAELELSSVPRWEGIDAGLLPY